MNLLPAAFLENFHFLRPLFLYALVPSLLFFFLLRLVQGSQSNWARAIDSSLLPYLLDKNSTQAQSLPLYGLLLVWILSVVAMAGPVWQEAPVPVQEREDSLVIVLDMSMSMYATDVTPNRSTRAQRKVIDILEYRRQEGQTGLVVYAGDAHAVTPMTDDVETIGNLVPSLQPDIMPILGSNPAAGVKLGLQLLDNSALQRARVLLMTDGIENSDVTEITNLLAGTGHKLSVLGFGTEGGSPIPIGQQGYLRDANNAIVIPRLERAPLQQLAAANGGIYTDAQLTDEDVVALLEQNVFAENENLVDVQDREFDAWEESGPWLLLLVIPLAAAAFRRGWLFVLLGCVMLKPAPSYAWEWRDAWERKDQQGIESFASEDFASASTQFEDPSWRAASNYRNEDYQAVVNDLSMLTDPESNYNRGNALAKLGQFESAIQAYDQTLAVAPDHADALHNKEIVQKLLEQQQQEQKDQQEQSGDQQQQEQDQGEQPQDQQNQDQQQQQSGDQQQQQQQQQQSEQEQQNQEQQDQEQAQQEESEQDEQKQDQQQAQSEPMDSEEEQAMQQWLMRIPDDPGELLRNKFRYQAQQDAFQQLQNPSQQPTNQRTW